MSTAARGGRLGQRALTALVGIPLALLVIYFGGWYLAAAVALLALLGVHEFYGLTKVEDRFIAGFGYLGAAALVVGARVAPHGTYHYTGLGIALLVALGQLASWLARKRRERVHTLLRQVAAVTVGWAYVPFLFGYLLQLRGLEALRPLPHWLPAGAGWVFLVIACCWVMDTAAYLVGRAIGRHKLAPKISPGKTVEGAIAGLVAAMAWTAGLGITLGLTVGQGLALGAVLGVGGQVGDLFESLLKRRAGVKDSGTLLPGHGGVLDRFDSLLFCAPLGYAVLALFLR